MTTVCQQWFYADLLYLITTEGGGLCSVGLTGGADFERLKAGTVRFLPWGRGGRG
jgi:hypothetical protein